MKRLKKRDEQSGSAGAPSPGTVTWNGIGQGKKKRQMKKRKVNKKRVKKIVEAIMSHVFGTFIIVLICQPEDQQQQPEVVNI